MKSAIMALVLLCGLVSQAQAVGEIRGPGTMVDDADAIQVILALPEHYRECHPCMALNNAFRSDPSLVSLKKIAVVHIMAIGDPEYTNAYRRILPNVEQGEPMVCVLRISNGKAEVYSRLTCPDIAGLGDKLKDVIENLKEKCPFCPKPKPSVLPKLDDDYEPPAKEKVEAVVEAVDDSADIGKVLVVVALVACAAAFTRYYKEQ